MRPIDADDLDNVVLQLNKEGRAITSDEYAMLYHILFKFPKIEAEPVRRGRWLAIKEKAPWLVCSECGTYLCDEQKSVTKYCYNCGAKMEEQEGD